MFFKGCLIVFSILAPGLGQMALGQQRLGQFLFGGALLAASFYYYLSGANKVLYFIGAGVFWAFFIFSVLHFFGFLLLKSKSLEPGRTRFSFLLIAFVLFMAITKTMKAYPLYRSYMAPSTSMVPALITGDIILVKSMLFSNVKVKHGDIIVFKSPKDGIPHIQRVVALSGDKVSTINNQLVLNDQKIQQTPVSDFDSKGHPYLERYKHRAFEETLGDVSYTVLVTNEMGEHKQDEYVVPTDSVYVLGDNRSSALDSRMYGAVPAKNVIGKLKYKLFPGRMRTAQ